MTRSFAVLFVAACAGCATAPVLLPAAPLGAASVQAGAGALVEGGSTLPAGAEVGGDRASYVELGGGGTGFVDVALPYDLHVVASGHGAYLRALDPSVAIPQRFVGGGRGGVRWVKPLLGDHLYIGGEAMVGYLTSTGFSPSSTTHWVTASVGMPVAEAAPIPGLFVYTDAVLGIAVPLHPRSATPFIGFFELPLGISWQVLPWLVLVAEGGLSSPVQGPYGALGLAVRL